MTQNNYEQSLTESVDAYLDTVHHVKTDVQGNINDNVRVVIKSEYDYTLREIICNLLAGRGLKVPNLQICLNANLKALLGDPRIAEELKEALQSLSDAFDEFMEHTNIENVLNRINNALAEVTQVANMINFCATPVKPKAIPNVLENIMNSYLGAGKDLCDKLGRLIPDQVSACLLFSSDGTSQFNTNLFEGGLLGQIADDWDRIISGELTQNEINAFLATIDDIKEDFQKLVRFDNDVAGSYDLGGSSFGQIDVNINKSLGVLHNPASAGIQGNTRIAAQLKTTFDRLAGYPVVDADGNVHDNIFDLILEPDMLELLRKIPDPTPDIGASQPVYDYCGNIIGYTTSFSQEEKKKSAGEVPTPPANSPGFNAGGLPTTSSDLGTGTTSSGGDTTIINSTGNISVLFVNSESAMLALNPPVGSIVVRTDIDVAFGRSQSSSPSLISDYVAFSVPFSNLLTSINDLTSSGIVVANDGIATIREIKGTANQTVVANGDGVSNDITIGLVNNPVIPGQSGITIPSGNTSQRGSGQIAKIRYNTTTNKFEGYTGGSSPGWTSLSGGVGTVTGTENIGTGDGWYSGITSQGILQFKSVSSSGAIDITPSSTELVISESLGATNIGTGVGSFSGRIGNNFSFKSISGEQGVSVTEDNDTIVISCSNPVYLSTTTTSSDIPEEVFFDGSRIAPSSDSSWFFTLTAIGRTATGLVSTIRREGIVDNTTGSVSVISDDSSKVIFNNNLVNEWDVTVADTAGIFQIFVTGEPSNTVSWKVKVEFLSVSS